MAAQKPAARVFGEALLVAVLGALIALLANAVSPRGLSLSRNYFPGAARPTAMTAPRIAAGVTNTNNLSSSELLAAHFREEGLQLADSNQVIRLFHDPRVEQNLVVFVDARSEAEYQRGHVPGAWHYDYFHHENYLPSVAPVCQAAQQIVFYCGGGACELSEHAAIDLRDILSLPKEKLLVYAGGFNEWTNNRLPVEVGERKSGNLSTRK